MLTDPYLGECEQSEEVESKKNEIQLSQSVKESERNKRKSPSKNKHKGRMSERVVQRPNNSLGHAFNHNLNRDRHFRYTDGHY